MLFRSAGPHVQFLGRLTDDEIRGEYRRAAAVLMPGEEDFGIVPVEAQACGRPVVALARGSAVETVVDGETGVLVAGTTPEAWAGALSRVSALRVDVAALQAHANRFSRERHATQMQQVIAETLDAPVGTRW